MCVCVCDSMDDSTDERCFRGSVPVDSTDCNALHLDTTTFIRIGKVPLQLHTYVVPSS